MLSIDNTSVRDQQIQRLNVTKQSRDETQATQCLERLTESASLKGESTGSGLHPMNLLNLAVDAARARCTVGEISGALEASFGRHVAKVRHCLPAPNNSKPIA